MIRVRELRRMTRARLADAEALFKSRRYDAAVYICGYAVEIALKARVCRTLSWAGYPDTRAEFQRYSSFRTHSLDVLLHISGREDKVKQRAINDWNEVSKWDPESRYHPVAAITRQQARTMIDSARVLVRILA